ncbi:1-(5-phosphoribosyl)-5-[(5-phosphoribosylamino)methylideneamino]imidazole-4-carboxamide isomerase [soil metagenome]
MLVIPAIDIRDGKCVRLIQGDYDRQLTYDAEPIDMARSFHDDGAKIVHVVDLDGAKLGEPQNWKVVEHLCQNSPIPVEFGGGVRTLATAKRLLDFGALRVVVGSALINNPEEAEKLLALGDRVVAGLDARNGMIAITGWTEGSSVSASELAQHVEKKGAKRIILTDIAKDGMLAGPNLELLAQVQAAISIPVIQSGGISSLRDLEDLLELAAPPEGAIIGRALYEGKVNLKEACRLSQ